MEICSNHDNNEYFLITDNIQRNLEVLETFTSEPKMFKHLDDVVSKNIDIKWLFDDNKNTTFKFKTEKNIVFSCTESDQDPDGMMQNNATLINNSSNAFTVVGRKVNSFSKIDESFEKKFGKFGDALNAYIKYVNENFGFKLGFKFRIETSKE